MTQESKSEMIYRSLPEALEREWSRISQVRRSTFAYVPERSNTSVEEHDAILALIETNADALQIELAARSHRLRTMDQFLVQNNLAAQGSRRRWGRSRASRLTSWV